MPVVSVIIPVYNGSIRIREALDGLVEQSYSTALYEVIVVDNDSTDATRTVVSEYERQTSGLIRLAVERKVRSAYAARNKGICIANGEILAFTDADCVPQSSWIEKGLEALQESSAAFAAGRIDMTFKAERPNLWEYFDAARKLNQRAYVEKAGFGATANLFVRRRLFHKYGMFRTDLQSGGDYEFGCRLTKAGEKLVYAEKAVVRHPARRTFKTILSKSRRVARGQKQLEKLGLLQHNALSWHQLIPVRGYPSLGDVSLNLPQRLAVVLMVNFIRYYNFVWRL